MHRCLTLAAMVAAHSLAPMAMAQSGYEPQDQAAAVLSERTSVGTSAQQRQAQSVIATPAAAAAASAPPAAAATPAATPTAAPPYRRFVITRPADRDTVLSNTGELVVVATLTPPLRPNDRVRVLLDGRLLNGVYRSTQLRIGAADRSAAVAAASVSEHTLQLVVVDDSGKPSIESPAVRFHVRRTAVGGTDR